MTDPDLIARMEALKAQLGDWMQVTMGEAISELRRGERVREQRDLWRSANKIASKLLGDAVAERDRLRELVEDVAGSLRDLHDEQPWHRFDRAADEIDAQLAALSASQNVGPEGLPIRDHGRRAAR